MATWIAALSVVIDRDAGELARTRRLGWVRFETAVRKHVTKAGGQKPCLRIARRVFAALADPVGVHAHRPGALERVALLLEDWRHSHARPRRHRGADGCRARRTRVDRAGHLDHRPVPGRGRRDPRPDRQHPPLRHRPSGGQHAGLAPRQKLSGSFVGKTKLTGQGRPGLRLAAWRAVWGAQRANPVIAAAILRHLHAVITTGQRWDPLIATHGTKTMPATPIAA